MIYDNKVKVYNTDIKNQNKLKKHIKPNNFDSSDYYYKTVTPLLACGFFMTGVNQIVNVFCWAAKKKLSPKSLEKIKKVNFNAGVVNASLFLPLITLVILKELLFSEKPKKTKDFK